MAFTRDGEFGDLRGFSFGVLPGARAEALADAVVLQPPPPPPLSPLQRTLSTIPTYFQAPPIGIVPAPQPELWGGGASIAPLPPVAAPSASPARPVSVANAGPQATLPAQVTVPAPAPPPEPPAPEAPQTAPSARPATGTVLAGATAGFLLGGPLGAAVGAGAGWFLGRK